MTRSITNVIVVVPARDEAALIAKCIRSVLRASATLTAARPGIDIRVVTVADSCTDNTERIGRAAGSEVIVVNHRAVGAARQAGIDYALEPALAASTWIATTDADSTVPHSWLVDHVAAADRGATLVIGGVEPDPASLDPLVLAAWHHLHDQRQPTESIHGANLGFRADALAAVGGFAPTTVHEDVDIVARLRAAGALVESAPHARVSTSGRTTSRVDGGFASYMADLRGTTSRASTQGLGDHLAIGDVRSSSVISQVAGA